MQRVDLEGLQDFELVLQQPETGEAAQKEIEPSRVLRALEAARSSFWAALGLVSVLSAYVGVVYWIAQGWLLGVVLSALMPGFGLISILSSLAG